MIKDLRESYLIWLRDAHAMEEQAETMMRGLLARLDNYPELSQRIRQHLAETERQASALRTLLDERASGTSMVKDAMGKIAAAGQSLGGIFVSDEVIKGSMASYTFEHMEIAAYKVLIATARQLGDDAAASVFEHILAEEQAMADWLYENLDTTTRRYLARDAADVTARR